MAGRLSLHVELDTTAHFLMIGCRYLVTHLMGADLSNIVKTQKLTDDHVQFLVYQLLRGLKVSVIVFSILFCQLVMSQLTRCCQVSCFTVIVAVLLVSGILYS